MADGSIRINTKLNNEEINQDLNGLQQMMKRTANNLKRMFDGSANTDAIKKQIAKQKQSIKDNEKQIQSYQKALDNLDGQKAVKEVQKLFDQNNKEIEKAKKRIEEYQAKLDEIDTKKSLISAEEVKASRIGFNDTDDNIDKRVEKSLESNKDYQNLLSDEKKIVSEMDKYADSLRKAESNARTLKQTLQNTKNNLVTDYTSGIEKSNTRISKANQKVKSLSKELDRLKRKADISKSVNKSSTAFQRASKYARNFGNHIHKTTQKGTKSLIKMAAAVFSIRGIYTLARRAASEYLNSNEQLANQVQGIWNAVAQAVGPIVNQIISWVVTLISYINAFIKMLTGIDLVAKGNAAALNKQASAAGKVAKETEKANKQLAAFDEMNVLQSESSNGGGGDSSGAQVPVLEVDQVNIDDIVAKLEKLFEPFASAWDKYGEAFISSFKYGLNSIWELIKTIASSFEEVWLNGTGEKTCSLIFGILTDIFNTIGNISSAFAEAWNTDDLGTSIIQHLANIFNSYLEIIKSFTEFIEQISQKIDFTPILNCLDSILGLLDDISGIGATFWNDFLVSALNADWASVGKSISTAFSSMFDTIKTWLANIDWYNLGYNIAEMCGEGIRALGEILLSIDWVSVFASLFVMIGEILVSGFELLVGTVIANLKWIWEVIQSIFNYENMFDFISGVIQGIADVLGTIGAWFDEKFSEAWSIMCDIFSGIREWASERVDDIFNAFKEIPNWFNDKFTQAFQYIEDAFSNIREWAIQKLTDITDTFHSIGAWFAEKFSEAWENITSAFSNVGTFFSDVWSNIKNAFGNVAGWFKDKFSKAWQAVKDVFSKGGKIFDGIKDGILKGLKSVINGIIDGINKIIYIPFSGLNSALARIRNVSIFGFEPFSWLGSISVPQIPKLARGGIVNNPGPGVNMGDYIAGERGAEAIVPLENSDFVQSFAKQIASVLQEMDKPVNIVLQIGDKEFYKWLINMKRKYDFILNGG